MFFVLTSSNAKGATFYGAYYGDIKDKIENYQHYPDNRANSAGFVYLKNKKISNIQYIVDKKIDQIDAAMRVAKEYANEKKYRKYAVDNIKHQVIFTEKKVIVMTDYNVIVFN